jgi:hypothetical protein
MVRKRAAWLADRFIRRRARDGQLTCDNCGFDPATKIERTAVKARSLLDVHHMDPLNEGVRYTTQVMGRTVRTPRRANRSWNRRIARHVKRAVRSIASSSRRQRSVALPSRVCASACAAIARTSLTSNTAPASALLRRGVPSVHMLLERSAGEVTKCIAIYCLQFKKRKQPP